MSHCGKISFCRDSTRIRVESIMADLILSSRAPTALSRSSIRGMIKIIKRWQTDLNWKIFFWSFGTSTRIRGRGFLDLVEIILVTLIGARP
jgi:hypothetical protein